MDPAHSRGNNLWNEVELDIRRGWENTNSTCWGNKHVIITRCEKNDSGFKVLVTGNSLFALLYALWNFKSKVSWEYARNPWEIKNKLPPMEKRVNDLGRQVFGANAVNERRSPSPDLATDLEPGRLNPYQAVHQDDVVDERRSLLDGSPRDVTSDLEPGKPILHQAVLQHDDEQQPDFSDHSNFVEDDSRKDDKQRFKAALELSLPKEDENERFEREKKEKAAAAKVNAPPNINADFDIPASLMNDIKELLSNLKFYKDHPVLAPLYLERIQFHIEKYNEANNTKILLEFLSPDVKPNAVIEKVQGKFGPIRVDEFKVKKNEKNFINELKAALSDLKEMPNKNTSRGVHVLKKILWLIGSYNYGYKKFFLEEIVQPNITPEKAYNIIQDKFGEIFDKKDVSRMELIKGFDKLKKFAYDEKHGHVFLTKLKLDILFHNFYYKDDFMPEIFEYTDPIAALKMIERSYSHIPETRLEAKILLPDFYTSPPTKKELDQKFWEAFNKVKDNKDKVLGPFYLYKFKEEILKYNCILNSDDDPLLQELFQPGITPAKAVEIIEDHYPLEDQFSRPLFDLEEFNELLQAQDDLLDKLSSDIAQLVRNVHDKKNDQASDAVHLKNIKDAIIEYNQGKKLIRDYRNGQKVDFLHELLDLSSAQQMIDEYHRIVNLREEGRKEIVE